MTNEFALVFAKHNGEFMLVPFCELKGGDYLPIIDRTVGVASHLSGDATFNGWLLYDNEDESWYPEDLEWQDDEDVEELLAEFSDVPMNPETECIESEWLHFPAGTNREEIRHWFEETFDVRMKGSLDEMSIQITFTEDDLEWMCEKFDIEDETDLYNAVWECISTYMEM